MGIPALSPLLRLQCARVAMNYNSVAAATAARGDPRRITSIAIDADVFLFRGNAAASLMAAVRAWRAAFPDARIVCYFSGQRPAPKDVLRPHRERSWLAERCPHDRRGVARHVHAHRLPGRRRRPSPRLRPGPRRRAAAAR